MAQVSRPNVLYFITHDTGRFLNCYGRPVPSPNLDHFARQGARFDRAFCQSPACGPSRVCVTTAQAAHRSGIIGLGNMGWRLPADRVTMVDRFNAAGYQTAHFGFMHERLYGEMRYEVEGAKTGDRARFWKDDARLVVDHAIEFLTTMRDTGRPFHMNCSTGETHTGHRFRRLHTYGGAMPENQAYIPPHVPDLPGIRREAARYAAQIRYLDAHFGRLMDQLDNLNLADNTIVVYTTDHGISHVRAKGHVYEMGTEIALLMRGPGVGRGQVIGDLISNIDFMPTLLEACGIDIPTDIDGRSFWPRLAPGNGGPYVPRDAVFLERNFHGERKTSHVNQAYGKERGGDPEYFDFFDPQRSIRTPQFQYIRHFRPDARPRPPYRHEIVDWQEFAPPRAEGDPITAQPTGPRPAEELYDLRHDPCEQVDLAQRPEYQEIKRELAARLEQWMRTTDDFILRLPAGEIPTPPADPGVWPTRG